MPFLILSLQSWCKKRCRVILIDPPQASGPQQWSSKSLELASMSSKCHYFTSVRPMSAGLSALEVFQEEEKKKVQNQSCCWTTSSVWLDFTLFQQFLGTKVSHDCWGYFSGWFLQETEEANWTQLESVATFRSFEGFFHCVHHRNYVSPRRVTWLLSSRLGQ